MVTVNPHLFVLKGKTEGEYILYTPLPGSALAVNDVTVLKLQELQKGNYLDIPPELKEKLTKHAIIGEKFPEVKRRMPTAEYLPTAVTLLPTWDCQLRCTYCYAHGGEDVKKDMTLDIGKASIDFVVGNALSLKSKDIQVGFHGGGEPLLPKNLPLLDAVLSYAREKTRKNDLELRTNAVTNAVMSDKTIEWMLKNLNSVSVSWDGLPYIQDAQRPIRGGRGSSAHVLNTLSILDEHDFPYGLRATVTDRSVEHLPEIVEFVARETKTKHLQLEQLFSCGRCEETGEKPPREEAFITGYLQAREVAKKYGISLSNSCSDITRTRGTFCGAAGKNFFVTPAGDITTCLEVTRTDDPAKEIFFIGHYDKKSDAFKMDKDKIIALKSRTTDNMNGCGECFAQYSCSGDCMAKVLAATGSLKGTVEGGYRCETNRALLKESIYSRLTKDEV